MTVIPLDNFISILDSGDGVLLQFRVGRFYQVPLTYELYDEFVKLVAKRQNEITPLSLRQAIEVLKEIP